MSAATPPAACLAAIRHNRKIHNSSSLLRDTGAAIGGLSVVEFQELVAKGIDKIDATDNVPTVYVAKVASLLPGMLTTSDVVTLSETGTAIGTMSVADTAGLAGKFIDRIDSVNGAVAHRGAVPGAGHGRADVRRHDHAGRCRRDDLRPGRCLERLQLLRRVRAACRLVSRLRSAPAAWLLSAGYIDGYTEEC